jgi:predicted membrane protein
MNLQNSSLDLAMIIFGVIMLSGSWYVYKLAKFSDAWKEIWIYFGLFLIFLPGTRVLHGLIFGACPLTTLEYILQIFSPVIGALFFFLSFKKLYNLFHKYINNGGKFKNIGRN